MPASDDQAAAASRRLGAQITQLARQAFALLLEAIRQGLDPAQAVAQVQASFEGQYAQQLAAAFSLILTETVGVPQMLAMTVGDVPLSARLYAHREQTAQEVAAVVRQHVAGVTQARQLALDLFDGYVPANQAARPLEGRARASLPKELLALVELPADRDSLQIILQRGRARAAALRTAPLRAAYLEAFDAWAEGRGGAILSRRLEVAYREKTRYMANRIAQTELSKAHQDAVGRELMADQAVEVVEVRLNPAHPGTDICDLYARADLFGLGPGRYPKARAPRPPFHPFCWCRLRARQDLDATGARLAPGADVEAARAYLRRMPADEAAAVLGSREKLRVLLEGGELPAVDRIGAAVSPRPSP